VKLRGRGILITGANQGFGKVVAQACVAEGAHLVITARNAALLETARAELALHASTGQEIIAQTADVSDPAQVSALVKLAAERLPDFSGLVNNAGVYGPKGAIEDVDWLEWVRAIEINLYGTVLPCREALPVFRKNGFGKIVNLSGGGATAPLPRISAYAASKAAVVRFTETISEEARGSGVDINAVAPGALNTRLLDEVLQAGPAAVGQDFYDRAIKQRDTGGAPLERGAALCVYLLSRESDGITGRLLSAIWDPWETLATSHPELSTTDIYTLRRIVPKDRGGDW
jgi:NAD(P)-dependent dehydrogenase (short-subunit alcohol dehydrogenase family)